MGMTIPFLLTAEQFVADAFFAVAVSFLFRKGANQGFQQTLLAVTVCGYFLLGTDQVP